MAVRRAFAIISQPCFSWCSYNYQYDLKDHLGDVRVTFDKNGSGQAEVIQEDECYAFGLGFNRYDNSNTNKYLYNGKEVQTDLTDQYDYGARFYDPVIGRWTTPDPDVEDDQETATPYVYVVNNPIRLTDPDGRKPCCNVIVGATAGGIMGGATAAAGTVALVGTGTVVGAPVGYIVAGGILLGGGIGAGVVWLWDHAHHSSSSEPASTPQSTSNSREGKDFTPKGKKTVIDDNNAKNNGQTVCEHCGVPTTKPEQSKKGQTPPGTDTQVDHVKPKSKGGSGTPDNGKVLCRDCNIKKGDKDPTTPQPKPPHP